MAIKIVMIISMLCIPLALLIIGLLKPKKNINGYIGFRTALTRSSQEAWDYSQMLMKKYFLYIGSVMLILSVIAVFIIFNMDENTLAVVSGMIVTVQGIVIVIVSIILNNRIKKKYGSNTK